MAQSSRLKVQGLATAALLAAAGMGCFEVQRSSTPVAPSALVATLAGSWSSASSGSTVAAGPCTGIQWQLTNQTANSASGTFSAVCFGNLTLTGSVMGNLEGSAVTWTASGTATSPTLTAACPFSLNGTGALEGDAIRVSYTGTTCLGPVSGSDLLRR